MRMGALLPRGLTVNGDKGDEQEMTREEAIYIGTLELLGSDIEPPEIQEYLNKEHAAADPVWAEAHRLQQAEALRKDRATLAT